jgi:hypothetical protein
MFKRDREEDPTYVDSLSYAPKTSKSERKVNQEFERIPISNFRLEGSRRKWTPGETELLLAAVNSFSASHKRTPITDFEWITIRDQFMSDNFVKAQRFQHMRNSKGVKIPLILYARSASRLKSKYHSVLTKGIPTGSSHPSPVMAQALNDAEKNQQDMEMVKSDDDSAFKTVIDIKNLQENSATSSSLIEKPASIPTQSTFNHLAQSNLIPLTDYTGSNSSSISGDSNFLRQRKIKNASSTKSDALSDLANFFKAKSQKDSFESKKNALLQLKELGVIDEEEFKKELKRAYESSFFS